MGRKSKYDEEIKPHLKEIKEAVEGGATIEEIGEAFGIAPSTIYRYKLEKEEFREIFARGREIVVFKIKNALLKKALGYDYIEERKVAKKDKKEETIVQVETYKRHCPPSETAAAMLLRNYDKTWTDKDATTIDLKKQENELKKAIAEADHFDLEVKS